MKIFVKHILAKLGVTIAPPPSPSRCAEASFTSTTEASTCRSSSRALALSREVAGRRIDREAELTSAGLEGDRIVQVRGPEGIRSARVHYRLLGLHGTLDADGRPLIDGQPWDSHESTQRYGAPQVTTLC